MDVTLRTISICIAMLGSVELAQANASAILTVATSDVRVDGVAVRAPLALTAGNEIIVSQMGRAVVYVPASGTEYEIGPGVAQFVGDVVAPSLTKPSSIRTKTRNIQFKTARLNGSVLLQAGGQFKNGGSETVPDRQIVLPRHIEFSWPIADREGPFRFQLFAPDGEAVVNRVVEITRITVDTIPGAIADGDYRWRVVWQDPQKRERAIAASIRMPSAQTIAAAESLYESVSGDSDGRALFSVWAATQREAISAGGAKK